MNSLFWKFRHRLFKTDFVVVAWDGGSLVRPIETTPSGAEYIKIYSTLEFLDDEKGRTGGGRLYTHLTRVRGVHAW